MTISNGKIAVGALVALSCAHFSNDLIQSIIPAMYPLFEENLGFNLKQIGIIALVYQVFASLFQPLFGIYFDKYPRPYYLPVALLFSIVGLTVLSFANNIQWILVSVAFVGIGSSIIHPEASRMTHIASGGKHGIAQSVFQVGGTVGGSIGPLLAALIITPYGQRYALFFVILAFLFLIGLIPICRWYSKVLKHSKENITNSIKTFAPNPFTKGKTAFALTILLLLLISKYVYLSSLTNYYTFYLIDKFDITTKASQICLFVFLFSSALGILIGGPVGDRYGRKLVIWVSIIGAAPFSLMLPYCNLTNTILLSSVISFVISSAFSAMIVYAQELLPSKVGLISGLFFGLAFGVAGIAAAILGWFADKNGIESVYVFCSYIPLTGVIALLLPNMKLKKQKIN